MSIPKARMVGTKISNISETVKPRAENLVRQLKQICDFLLIFAGPDVPVNNRPITECKHFRNHPARRKLWVAVLLVVVLQEKIFSLGAALRSRHTPNLL